MQEPVPVRFSVNGEPVERSVEPRMLLSDFLRHELELTGTHVGCEHGVCGACTVLLDGESVRSCLMFAVQAEGAEVSTVEGLSSMADGPATSYGGPDAGRPHLHILQEAFRDEHGLQCGFCTPGFLMTLIPFLRDNPSPSETEIREAVSGNLCRCTGYQNIIRAVQSAAARLESEPGSAA